MYYYVHNLLLSYSCSDFVECFLLNKREIFTFSLLLMMMGGLLKLLLDGWESWHAIIRFST